MQCNVIGYRSRCDFTSIMSHLMLLRYPVVTSRTHYQSYAISSGLWNRNKRRGRSIYLLGMAMSMKGAESLLSDFCELKIQTCDIGAYWFCKHKTHAKRYELANPMQFYLIQKDIKRWNIFFQYFRYSNVSQNAVLFESRKRIKITCQICFYLSLDNRAKIQCWSIYSNEIQKLSIFLVFPER